ncbi:glycosyltransferase [Cerasicoccus arenae]|uniref:Glycosyl transferase n=1 Tax=Cerasicoccus arenae TaxID=424488 RepID=A0A8J3DAB6_9BACT|nr:galactosyltransferase-related protein [Cerasicoccus arenae]MBK1859015.1 glycosyltransferase [Cerasicoccus arenae]GHB94723.1 glycosyl transferase [Cerasicoccus arenae]
MSNAPSIGLVINTYNAPEKLEAVFHWLAVAGGCDEVLVADDGSKSETRELIATWQNSMPRWGLKHIWQEDQGYRRSRILNRTIAQANADYLVFIDGDCLPFKRFITDHQALAERGAFVQGRRCFVPQSKVKAITTFKTSIFSLLITGQLGGAFKAIRWPMPVIKRNRELHGILGCNLGIWRDDLIAVNGYDESFEGWGAEDSDLAARLYHHGLIRKFVYGRAQLAHLNHDELPRDRYDANKEKLTATLGEKRVRCSLGLDQHLQPEA